MSTIMSAIAIIVSVISFAYQFFQNRKNLKCNTAYFWKTFAFPDEYCYCLTPILENRSKLPISITKANIVIDGETFEFHNENVFLYGGGDETQIVNIFSNELPIFLNGLSANTFRILFFIGKDIEPESLTLILETTRGKITINNIKVNDNQY